MKHVFSKYLRWMVPVSLTLDTAGAGGGSGDAGAGSGAAGGDAGASAGAGTSAPPVTDVRTYLDDKGQITKPDEFWKAMGAPHLAKRFTSLDATAKSYVNAERMLSNGNKIAVPGDNSTPEEWDAFYKGIGRPDSEDKYEVTIPDEIKGMTLDEAAMKEFRSTAFKNGLNGKQVKALTDFYFKSTKSAIDSVQAKLDAVHTEAVTALESDWGPKDGAKYKENVALAEKGAAVAGLSGDVLKANPALSNNPHFIRAMAKVASMVKEEGAANLRGGPANLGPDVDSQISAIKNDPKHPFWVKGHPDHAKAVATMEGLYQKKFAEPSKT